MFIGTAYRRRNSLSDAELGRLLVALKDEAERYRHAIRNYPPDRLERYGTPFLAKLETQVAVVERLVEERGQRSA